MPSSPAEDDRWAGIGEAVEIGRPVWRGTDQATTVVAHPSVRPDELPVGTSAPVEADDRRVKDRG